jgi:hypothetical protein
LSCAAAGAANANIAVPRIKPFTVQLRTLASKKSTRMPWEPTACTDVLQESRYRAGESREPICAICAEFRVLTRCQRGR